MGTDQTHDQQPQQYAEKPNGRKIPGVNEAERNLQKTNHLTGRRVRNRRRMLVTVPFTRDHAEERSAGRQRKDCRRLQTAPDTQYKAF